MVHRIPPSTLAYPQEPTYEHGVGEEAEGEGEEPAQAAGGAATI